MFYIKLTIGFGFDYPDRYDSSKISPKNWPLYADIYFCATFGYFCYNYLIFNNNI